MPLLKSIDGREIKFPVKLDPSEPVRHVGLIRLEFASFRGADSEISGTALPEKDLLIGKTLQSRFARRTGRCTS
jgi:hypothetical protein